MVNAETAHMTERRAILEWTARIGAVTAEAVAARQSWTVRSSRSRLAAAERSGLVSRTQPLARRPALYSLTRAGLRASGLSGLDPCRVSAANAAHAIACAEVAAALERCYGDHSVLGERELRRDERESGTALASASLGHSADGAPLLHRPDLVLWPVRPRTMLPVAVEVELTIKAPRRLLEICRAWARCRCVEGVLYLAPPEVMLALMRAVDKADAGERVVIVPLGALSMAQEMASAPIPRNIPSGS